MIEAIIILAVVCAVQSALLASLPFLLWRFIDQREELARVRADVVSHRKDFDELDKVVDAALNASQARINQGVVQ